MFKWAHRSIGWYTAEWLWKDVCRLSCINLHFTVTIDRLNGCRSWQPTGWESRGQSVFRRQGGNQPPCHNLSRDAGSGRWHRSLIASARAWNSNYFSVSHHNSVPNVVCSGEHMSRHFLYLSLITTGLSIDCIDHFHDGTCPGTHSSLSPSLCLFPSPLCLVVRIKFPQKQRKNKRSSLKLTTYCKTIYCYLVKIV